MCERIAVEWLSGNIERELDILADYGVLDDVPDELFYDGSMAIEFESPAVHMQKSGAITGLYQTMDAVLSMAQTNPAVLEIFDMENALRKIIILLFRCLPLRPYFIMSGMELSLLFGLL